MDLATAKELNENVTALGKGFEDFKATHTKSLTDRDVLLDEKMKKLSDLIGEKHEAALTLIRAEVAKDQRPTGGDSPEIAKEAKDAEQFAIHRKSIQVPDESKTLSTMRNMYGADYPSYEPEENVGPLKRYAKAFRRYLQVGIKENLSLLGPEHQKDMSIGIDPDGGYFMLPPTIANGIVARIFETSPMWELSDVANISTRSLIIPDDPSDVNAGWVAERATRSTTSTFNPAAVEIPAQEEYAEPALSQQMLEDSAIDIEAYLTKKISDKLMRVENTAFISGNGAGKPKGILSYTLVAVTAGNTFSGWGNQLEKVLSGSSGAFTYNGLLNLETSLKEKFQANAKFMIRRQSIASLLQITDANNRLIFQPILNGNLNKQPLMGYELRYATDVPAVGAGANAMIFGDFKEGYQIVNRLGISVLRDPYTAKPFVLLYTRKRVGGAVKNFDAIKVHTLS